VPYYRILIWTKTRKNPFTGIRFIEQNNINNVYLMVMKKAKDTYRHDFLDCEIQMLSKLSRAVKSYLKKANKASDLG
jgi:RNA-splicing ligase RtcB